MRANKRLMLAAALLVPATAWAQVGGPVQPGDLVFGLSQSAPNVTTQLVRGGVLIGGWMQAPFLQSVEFDNLNGIPHNASGNLLALNWGGTDGGIIHSLATNGDDVQQTLFAFDGSQAVNVRINGLSVSPDNTRLALQADNASLFIMDYQAGNGDGTGAAITGFIEKPFAFTPGGNGQGTWWLDNDSLLLYRLDADGEVNESQLVRADIDGGGNVTLTILTDNIPVVGGSGEVLAVHFNPAIAPWVICSLSQFDGTTENTLTFIDPTDWSIVDAISLSLSLNTAREIALGSDNLLLMSTFGGEIGALDLDTNGDGVVDTADLPYADNSTVPFYSSGVGASSFNGIDIAGGGEPVIIFDGDFDALTVGDNPDCGNNAGAGAWFFGTSYVQAGVCELSVEQFSIAATTSFDPGAQGNSLHLLVASDPNSNYHLPNRFNVILQEGDPVTVEFDIWVASGGGGGGSVYVGGDHGGGGYDEATDRGPQLTWNNDREILASFGGQNTIVVASYPLDEWQSVRMEIDLVADTFDLFWGPRGGPLSPAGSDLGFRSGTQNMLDRFTVMNFGGLTADSDAYFDNVAVTLGGESCLPCDMNCDGTVDATDIEFFIDILFNGAVPCNSCTGDTNGDGRVDAADIEGFINCLFP